ncbi:MAG: SDR family oxidoreductase [Bacteroidota bacterium]|nr:SDR family oxidoreductase [Bacteroidota bacterium]
MNQKKVVVITGASSGIGLALSREYANKDFSVVMAARSNDKLNQYAKAMSKQAEVLAVQTDVTSQEDCKNLIEKTIEKFGRIDILINNAGISMRALFEDIDITVMRHLMDVNFWGTVYCTQHALPWLVKTKGTVVGVTSVAGIHGLPARSGYSASKFAMQGFLEAIRIENLHKKLHVLIIAPGFTASNVRKSALTANGTPQGKSPRDESNMMSPDKVARKIYKAIRQRRRFIVLTTVGVITNLVKKFWPAFLDHAFFRAMKNEPDSPLK